MDLWSLIAAALTFLSPMQHSSDLAQSILIELQTYITNLGFTPLVHFELEGCYQASDAKYQLNFSKINQQLKEFGIEGELVSEFWRNQWEYVSLFSGQTPLKEARNLERVITLLPVLFREQGIERTLIKPVVWSGDKGKFAIGSNNIFSDDERSVHIPNAIQLNVSVLDQQGNNLVAQEHFGEYLQQCFLQTSLSCCLLYLPEEEAFERFALKTTYGLAEELCSPNDISGGHQGSVALYKKLGKHNQKMGEKALLYGIDNQVLVVEHQWQKTARVEHRLGASSVNYNPYSNVIYALLNIIDALQVHLTGNCQNKLTGQSQQKLPLSLYDQQDNLGAISLFQRETWFSNSIDKVIAQSQQAQNSGLGKQFKQQLLADHQQAGIVLI